MCQNPNSVAVCDRNVTGVQLTHVEVLAESWHGRRVLLVHGSGKTDQQLIGSCASLLVNFLHTQYDLAHHASNHLHTTAGIGNIEA